MTETEFLAAFEQRIREQGIHIERREYHDNGDWVRSCWYYVVSLGDDWHGAYPVSEVAIRGAAAEGVEPENARKFAYGLADHALAKWGELHR